MTRLDEATGAGPWSSQISTSAHSQIKLVVWAKAVLLVLALAALKFLALKLLIFLVPLLWMTAKSVWVKFDPPPGEHRQHYQ